MSTLKVRIVSMILLVFFTLCFLGSVSVQSNDVADFYKDKEISMFFFRGKPLQPHEHPFHVFSEEETYSQEKGNGLCANLWVDHPGVQTTYAEVEGSLYTRYAYDGKEIESQWHIWYHQDGKFCVANV